MQPYILAVKETVLYVEVWLYFLLIEITNQNNLPSEVVGATVQNTKQSTWLL